jgi:drug/metabolite transporter (DMT)-like permease
MRPHPAIEQAAGGLGPAAVEQAIRGHEAPARIGQGPAQRRVGATQHLTAFPAQEIVKFLRETMHGCRLPCWSGDGKEGKRGNALTPPASQAAAYSAPVALFLLFACGAMFVSNTVAARFAPAYAPPIALAFWRWTTVALLLTPFVWRLAWRHRGVLRREAPVIFLLASCGMGLTGTTIYFAGETTTALNIIVIYAFSPVLIAVGAWALLREPASWTLVLGLVVATFGLLYTVTHGDLAVLLHMTFVAGDLWALLSTLAWTFYSLAVVRWPSALPPFVRMWAVAAAGALVISPFMLAETLLSRAMPATMQSVWLILFLGTVPSIGGYTLHAHLSKALGANRTAVIAYFAPVAGTLLAWIVLGERPEIFHLVGGVAVLAGTWLTTWKPAARA